MTRPDDSRAHDSAPRSDSESPLTGRTDAHQFGGVPHQFGAPPVLRRPDHHALNVPGAEPTSMARSEPDSAAQSKPAHSPPSALPPTSAPTTRESAPGASGTAHPLGASVAGSSTSDRLRAVGPGGVRRTSQQFGPRHATDDAKPADRRVAVPSYPAPAPAEGVTQFGEPGRQHLSDEHGQAANAIPSHLDPRVVGLTNTHAGRKRRWFGRGGIDVLAGNPNSGALHAPIHAPLRVGIVGLKGGVGKTTLSILLAKTAARERHHPVLLLDSDTTYGSLMLRTGIIPVASAHDIARMGDPGSRDLLSTTISRTEENVWVLPTGRSPEQSANFTDRTYVEAMRAVFRHFPMTVTDCGAGMAGPLMQRIISASHALVIATSPSMDGILASHNALQWLDSLGYSNLMRRTIVAITNVNAEQPQLDLAAVRSRFAGLCKAVVTVPTDPHLAPGSHLEYPLLSELTRQAARDLTAITLEAAFEGESSNGAGR